MVSSMIIPIDCESGGLVNGELFLELPDDKDFLDDLKLSPAFKRLIVRKAKEVCILLDKKLCYNKNLIFLMIYYKYS